MKLSTYAIDGFRYATTAEGDCAEDAALRAARLRGGTGESDEGW